jgi:ribosome maturation factor RimP
MALQIETIRATADRVAASHRLDVVDLEFTGGAKHRTLRVYLEKDAASRAEFAAKAASAAANPEAEEAGLPSGVPVEMLSFVTHEDCAAFATDFGTVLDIEDLIPGAEYTLEVSSPGLERKLSRPADFTRFTGSLLKVQTFTAINANRHFQARLIAFNADTQVLTLDLTAIKPKGKPKKAAGARTAPNQTVEIAFSNIEKANLIPEL